VVAGDELDLLDDLDELDEVGHAARTPGER
jgi:hypothetical protein